MKKKLLLILLLLAGLQCNSFASHFTGTELTYKAVSPNNYEVIFKLYRECNSVGFPTTVNIMVNAPGCNSGRSIGLNLTSQQIKTLNGPAMPQGCTTGFIGNFNVGTYTGTLTFSAAEQTCPDWVLSWSDCCRTDIANLNNAATSNIYTEAHLKLLPNLLNSSPQFDTINYNAAAAAYGQKILISALAQDADGDSLVYSSVAPLSGVNQPLTYAPVSGQSGSVIINPNPLPPFNTTTNPQVAVLPTGLNNYSPAFPLFSIFVNWVAGQQVCQAQPYFELNQNTGNMAFIPATYTPNAIPQNRYAITIQVDEYRKINRVATKIGSVRRDTYIDVIDAAGNGYPYLRQVEMNATAIAEGNLIELRPGITMNLKLAAGDIDTTNVVLMTTNVSGILPGALFSHNGANKPSGTVIWTPTAADVREQPYYFNVVLKDNANPLRGYHERTIGVRVRQNGKVTGIKSATAFNTNFTAYPNPSTEQVNFRFNQQTKAESIIIYNVLGRQVDQISISKTASGEQQITWQNAGKHAAGMYVAKLVSENKTIQTLKFTKLQ